MKEAKKSDDDEPGEDSDHEFRKKLAEVNELEALSHAETVHRMLRDLRAVQLCEEAKAEPDKMCCLLKWVVRQRRFA